jgi:hypothetical protein
MSLNKIVSYVAVVALVAVSVVMPILAQAQTAMTVGIVTPVAGSTVMVGQTVTFTAQAKMWLLTGPCWWGIIVTLRIVRSERIQLLVHM